MGNAIELAQDALLHLGCGLVGKGHGEDVTIVVGMLNEQAYEVDGQGEGLARARRGFIDVEIVVLGRAKRGVIVHRACAVFL